MATFKPRTTAPSKDDKNFINYKNGGYNTCIVVDSKTGSVLPNCVGYAQGRLLELLGWNKVNWNLPACNAEDWFETAKKNGFKVGQTPKLGAVIVWRAGQTHNSADGAGHVAVVEEIKSNGDIVVSNSAWQGDLFYMKTLTKASGYVYAATRPLVGFIYCGIEFEVPSEPTEGIRAGRKITLKNAKCYSSESATTSCGTKSGTFYLWDASVMHGRIRITNAASKVGVQGQVTCWIDVSSIDNVAPFQCIHTVEKGNTLWGLAVRYLDRGYRYTEIAELNELDSYTLTVGQKLKIPNK